MATILFADLVGSTALSGRLDPEALRAIVVRYFDLLASCIERHGGTVEKFIGDAVMAVFGVPTAHEDDVRRGLAAALEILESLDEFNRELEPRQGVRLEVRIGVNTGMVIATRDASRRQALVSGEVVNLAARLEQHAGAGEILIGADTYTAAGRAVVAAEPRSLLVKGKDEPIQAYPLLDLLPDDPTTTRRFDIPFVGRVRELAALDMVADRVATTGTSGVLMIYGEPGIGKTRLIGEWLSRTTVDPVAAVVRCRSYADDGSLRPLYELINQVSGDDSATADELAPVRDRLRAAVAENLPLSDVYQSLVDFLDALAATRPVVIVVDDLHWASELLLETVDRLCEDLAYRPVLCVCAARPDFAQARLRPGSGLLNYTSVEVARMPDDEVEMLAAAHVEVTAHDADAVRDLVVRAEGNPLHLEHLAAAVQDGHDLGQIPATLRALFTARLDVLPQAQRAVLDVAAVAGREFTMVDVAALLDSVPGAGDGQPRSTGHAALGEVLREMSRRRLVEATRRPRGDEPTHRFANAIIRDVTYQAMTKVRRAELHEKFAAVIAVRQPDGTAAAATRAHIGGHLEKSYRCRVDLGQSVDALAPLRRSALEHLVSAGAAAMHRVDLPWALDLLGRAVDLSEPGDPARARALGLYGETLLATGARNRAFELLTMARREATAGDAHAVAAHARLILAQLDPAAGPVADVAREVMDTFQREDDHLGLARARIRIGLEHQVRGAYREALGELQTALAHSVRAGTDIERANALGAIGQSLWLGPQPVDAAIRRCHELLAEHGAQRRAVQATLGFPFTVLLAIGGHVEAAGAQLSATQRAMSELGYAEAAVFGPLLEGLVRVHTHGPAAAHTTLRTAYTLAQRHGSATLVRMAAHQLARALLDAGLVDDASAVLDMAGDASANPSEAAEYAGLTARSAALRGRTDRALALALTSISRAEQTDSPVVLATARLDEAYCLLALGRRDEAATAARLARDAYQRKGHVTGAATAARLTSLIGPV